jgi:hypothetical protein
MRDGDKFAAYCSGGVNWSREINAREKKASALYLLHEKTESLPGLIVFDTKIFGLFNHGPVAAVVGKVKVTGEDVRESKRSATEIPRVIYIGQ